MKAKAKAIGKLAAKRKHKLNCQSAGGVGLVPLPWIYVNATIAYEYVCTYVQKEATLVAGRQPARVWGLGPERRVNGTWQQMQHEKTVCGKSLKLC